MTDQVLPFASHGYWLMLLLLMLARGADLFSTRLATPNLVLEGNPLARLMGWRAGGIFNVAVCFGAAFLPLTAIFISTSGFLVAAHNFHSAWIMRAMGEEAYRDWYLAQISRTRLPMYLTCLLGETLLTGAVGAGVMYFSRAQSVVFAIGLGIVTYAGIVLFYTSLSLWRLRRLME